MSPERSAVADPHPHETPAGEHAPAVAAGRAGPLETARAVLWSFFGVRGRAGHENDMARLHPVYVILTGVALAALFVMGLLTLVRWVVG